MDEQDRKTFVVEPIKEITAKDYLQALYGRCTTGQIVFVHNRNKVSAVFNVDQLDKAAAHVEREPLELFVRVNPIDYAATKERNPHGTGGTAEVAEVVGFHLDVDAAKNDKYLSQEEMVKALDAMPLAPSAIILTNGTSGGFHAYWWLHEPIKIESEEQRNDLQAVSNRWLDELREKASTGEIDSTADLCRILRPIGSKRRKTGNIVQAYRWDPEQRYNLDQFRLPELPSSEPEQSYSEPAGESIVTDYLEAVGENHPALLLERYAGYTLHSRSQNGDFYIRPGSESGAPTGQVHTCKDGRSGFTFKSGSCEPFTSTNSKGTNGRWYSTAAIYVTLQHEGDWKKAAAHCYSYFDKQRAKDEPKPDTSRIQHGPKPEPKPENAKQPEPVTRPAGQILTRYMQKINAGEFATLIPQREPLDRIEIGPGLVTFIGAPPGAGKTALALQVMFDGLELDQGLRAVVANAETSFEDLLRRELTRRTRIDGNAIRFGGLTPDDIERLNAAAGELIPRLQRVAVMDECNLIQLNRLLAEKQEPGLLVVDYVQKFAPPDKEPRAGVNAVVATLRNLARQGWAVLALSATKRDKEGKHSSSELGLSSFRESGEIEYNGDSAYVLVDNGPLEQDYIRNVTLVHCKNRHGPKADKQLQFHMPRMEFSSLPVAMEPHPDFDDCFSDDFAEAH